MTNPSGRASQVTPSPRSIAIVVAIRSDSFTRNSSASRTVVVPCARAASTARIGSSSIERTTRSPASSTARSAGGGPEITRSAIGSGPVVRTLSNATVPPIAAIASRKPVRVGLVQMFGSRTSRAPASSAAATRNADDDGSAGTSKSDPASWRSQPRVSIVVRRSATASGAPRYASIRSE